jgi:uncharacterized protein (TIGR02679 family)
MELRRAYWRNGRAAGTITLADATDAEHAGLAALDGRKVSRGPLRVRLADLDRRLADSVFACSLADLLEAYFGEAVGSRREEREAAIETARQLRESWRARFHAVAAELPDGAPARIWLGEGAHGAEWLARRYGSEPLSRQDERQAMIRVVARALTSLPLDPPRRLAVLANELTGNPHALDSSEELGRLFLAGLLDLPGAPLSLTSTPAERLSAAERRQLYASVGILTETVSPTVAVFNLAGATSLRGADDPVIAAGRPTLQVLALRQLLGWRAAQSADSDVYVLENPVVFEDLLDRLESRLATDAVPTIICTSGWPSDAGWRLLDLIHDANFGVKFHYSGDFDLAGLRIAAAVQKRLPDAFRAWRLGADDYRAADRDGGVAAAEDLAQLASLEPLFPDLVAAIREAGRWAYQEAIVERLAGDVVQTI